MSAGSLSGWSQISVSIGPGSTSFTSTPRAREVEVHRLREPAHRVLRRVVRGLVRDRDAAAHARHEHDRAASRARACAAAPRGSCGRGSGSRRPSRAATSAGVRSVTRVRFGIAALFTSTSSPPNASHASSATCSARSRSPRSAAHIRESGRVPRHRSSTSSSRSARRATMPTVAPRSARIGASAAPMPDDAPVTRIFEPSIFMRPRSASRSDSCSAHEKMPFDIVDASAWPGRRTPRPAPRAHPCRRARPAPRARRDDRRAAGRPPAASSARALGEPRRAAGERRRAPRASAAAGAGLRCDGSPSYQPP